MWVRLWALPGFGFELAVIPSQNLRWVLGGDVGVGFRIRWFQLSDSGSMDFCVGFGPTISSYCGTAREYY